MSNIHSACWQMSWSIEKKVEKTLFHEAILVVLLVSGLTLACMQHCQTAKSQINIFHSLSPGYSQLLEIEPDSIVRYMLIEEWIYVGWGCRSFIIGSCDARHIHSTKCWRRRYGMPQHSNWWTADTPSQRGTRITGWFLVWRRCPEKTYQGGYGIGKPNSHTTTGKLHWWKASVPQG